MDLLSVGFTISHGRVEAITQAKEAKFLIIKAELTEVKEEDLIEVWFQQ